MRFTRWHFIFESQSLAFSLNLVTQLCNDDLLLIQYNTILTDKIWFQLYRIDLIFDAPPGILNQFINIDLKTTIYFVQYLGTTKDCLKRLLCCFPPHPFKDHQMEVPRDDTGPIL